MSLDFSRCRLPPFQHQREDTEWVINHPYAFIASEMRTGKTKIVIDAAQFLYEAGIIDKVIVVTPAPVRDVWFDQDLGELKKHLWTGTHHKMVEFHTRVRSWVFGQSDKEPLHWYVTNYEFIRSRMRLVQLLPACTMKTLLVLDESSFIKDSGADRTKACLQLRRACGRVVLLNGTPIFHSPLDLLSQGNILHPSILARIKGKSCSKSLFLARYAIQTPILTFDGKPMENPRWPGHVLADISGWTNLDDLERRFAPYTVRRLQAECLDLPPKLDPVTLTATLEPATWKAYKDMRDDLVVWLKSGKIVTSATAAIKALRLSQITGGFLSGAEDLGVNVQIPSDLFSQLCTCEMNEQTCAMHGIGPDGAGVSRLAVDVTERTSAPNEIEDLSGRIEIGREKLDVLLWFIGERLQADPNLHLVAWSRYRAEVERAEREVRQRFPQFQTAVIWGSQKKSERLAALALLKPETSPTGPVFVAGIEGTGSFGLDMTAAHTCVSMATGYSPGRTLQTLDRVYGPGQTEPIAYYNIMAVGPRGQRTIDHDILVARMTGEGIAQRTAAAWVKILTEE